MEIIIPSAHAAGATLMTITKDMTLGDIFVNIMNVFILPLIAGVSVLFIIYGGVLFISSAGDPEKVTKARNTILWAVIGIIVVSLSYFIVGFFSGQIKAILG